MLVTAIVTTYNSEASICRTLQSIKNQRVDGVDFRIEIIVIDDCSTDRTAEIVENTFHDVLFIRNIINSGGPNRGRNIGLAIAKGDYISIVDHDDEWLPNKIAQQLKYLRGDIKIASSSYWQIDSSSEKKELRGNSGESACIYYKRNATFIQKLSKSKEGEKAYIGSLLFHNSLKVIKFEEEFGMVDFDWLLRMFENNCSVEIIQPLYNRYVDGSNLSLDEAYRLNDYTLSVTVIKQYAEKYPNLMSKSLKRVKGSMARYYYVVNKMVDARHYFLKSELTLKTILYYITSFFGSDFVKKHFNVFG